MLAGFKDISVSLSFTLNSSLGFHPPRLSAVNYKIIIFHKTFLYAQIKRFCYFLLSKPSTSIHDLINAIKKATNIQVTELGGWFKDRDFI